MKPNRATRRHAVPRARASPKLIGRPRDAQIDSEVVVAVLHALEDGGYRAVTIDGIAKIVGRARSSLYRRWPSKRHLVAYAVVSELGENPAADTGSLRADLLSAVGTLWRAFRGPLGHALAGLVADMAEDPALASSIRQQVLAPRRRSMRDAIERARVRGEALNEVDVELLLDMLTGPFYFRTLFGHAPMRYEHLGHIVDYILGVLKRGDPRRGGIGRPKARRVRQ
jgi:AcrR family transcriptional regulator